MNETLYFIKNNQTIPFEIFSPIPPLGILVTLLCGLGLLSFLYWRKKRNG